MGILGSIAKHLGGLAGGGIGAFFGGPIGAVAGYGIGDSFFGGSSANAKEQYEYQKDFYQHRYQWQTQDMLAAGLNPMSSNLPSAPSGGNVDVSGSENAKTNRMQMMANMASVASDVNLKKAEADNIKAKTVNEISSNALIGAQTREIQQKVDLLVPSQVNLNLRSYQKMQEEIKEVQARTRNLDEDSKVKAIDAVMKKNLAFIEYEKSEYLRKHPELVPFELGAGRSMLGIPAGLEYSRSTAQDIGSLIKEVVYGNRAKDRGFGAGRDNVGSGVSHTGFGGRFGGVFDKDWSRYKP